MWLCQASINFKMAWIKKGEKKLLSQPVLLSVFSIGIAAFEAAEKLG